jgi:hypothetical protein
MRILAAGDPPLTGLAQYGAAGLILTIFLWFGWQVYKRERDRADSNAAEIARLNEKIGTAYMESMNETAKSLISMMQMLESFRQLLESVMGDERPPPRRGRP